MQLIVTILHCDFDRCGYLHTLIRSKTDEKILSYKNLKIDLCHYMVLNCIKVLYLRIKGKEYTIKLKEITTNLLKIIKLKKYLLEKALKILEISKNQTIEKYSLKLKNMHY